MTTKTEFEVIDFNFEVIMSLSPDAYSFAEMWTNYLHSCGWTEQEFELELEKRIFTDKSQ